MRAFDMEEPPLEGEPPSFDWNLEEVAALERRLVALQTRLVIARAKGLLAQRRGVRVASASDLLEAYALEHELSVGEVARRFVADELTIEELIR